MFHELFMNRKLLNDLSWLPHTYHWYNLNNPKIAFFLRYDRHPQLGLPVDKSRIVFH